MATFLYMNLLQNEKSPYLLQHKDNPVDWYPWGDDAFAKARAEDKPIFLSIGYATCHWCHVMAHESFEDEEVAGTLNQHFISIKVDREERPDVDHIYMSVAQLLTGSGGWPLTIVMTPEKKPFFAATYIPKKSRFGSTGLIDLLETIAEKWTKEKNTLLKSATDITAALRHLNQNTTTGDKLNEGLLKTTFERLARHFDPVHGGFSRGTKFPTPHTLLFLLGYYQQTKTPLALEMVETTLKNMRAGGIFDQLGFGFHRYSTDDEWLVPHFEKMLYDQAMLLLAYTEAYATTENPINAIVVNEVITYLADRMRSPEGGFFSAEDADSEGVEGKYYVWTLNEIAQILSPDDAALFSKTFQISAFGNFMSHQTPPTTNIPHLDVAQLETWLKRVSVDAALDQPRQQLLQQRQKRIPPLLDDKILTDWNGLIIAALARAGRVLRNDSYVLLARNAASFIKENMTDPNGALLHRYRHGDAAITGQLDDYAFLIFGLIELHQATKDIEYLKWATTLEETVKKKFLAEDGSYYLADAASTDLIVRPKEFFDGALPSGNSVMLDNLLKLSRMLGNVAMEEAADRLAQAFYKSANRAPEAHTHFMLGLQFAMAPSLEIVVVGETNDSRTQALLDAAQNGDSGNRLILQKTQANSAQLTALAPYTKDQVALKDAPTAYVCTHRECKAPTHSPDTVKKNIQALIRQPVEIHR
ncbi:MAG: thioredoxin domain-containing protein [Deltaproteobacteria bacterium]|nr:thioredoxin domain-containing protein [Deltaproteobacteria bacterium]